MSKTNPSSPKKVKERWVPALDPKTLAPLPDLKVSNLGRVRRLARKITTKSGHERTYKAVDCKGTVLKSGYVSALNFLVHRLVYCSFNRDKVERGFVVHHKDNNPRNNKLINLEKITYSLNNEAKRQKKSTKQRSSRAWKGQVKRIKIKGEKWRVIPRFPNYEVSDFGRVFSSHFGGNLMNLTSVDGYLEVKISKGKREYQTFRVHRLVYETFVGEIPDGYIIHHKDHNRENNQLTNLECVTYSENTKAAIEAGVMKPHRKTLTQRAQLENAIMEGTCVDQIVKDLGFSRSHVLKEKRRLGLSKVKFNDKKMADLAVSLYKQGLSYEKISLQTGLAKEYLPKLMYKKGLSKSRSVSDETKQKILSDLQNSPQETMKKISERYNVSKTTVQDLNKAHGIRPSKASKGSS